MRDFARLSGPDRAALFEEAAARSGLPRVIVEKDFWVCWMLERLWSAPFAEHLLFKGGTSLSKCFGLIERFSEDIDIGIAREMLGFASERDPMADGLSRSARTKLVKSLKEAAQNWILGDFKDTISALIAEELGAADAVGWNWETENDSDGMPKLRWNPPTSLLRRRESNAPDLYLNRAVLIEIGSRAAHWPASHHAVTPYVAQQIPEAFTAPAAQICALEVARTFWEKATILHVLHHEIEHDANAGRPARQRERYSRHCYDLACILNSAEGATILNNFDLLADVVKFKRVFFCSSNAKEAQYDDARPGSFRLVPHRALNRFFATDYAKMQRSGMFFGAAPTWDAIRQTLQDAENIINNTKPQP